MSALSNEALAKPKGMRTTKHSLAPPQATHGFSALAHPYMTHREHERHERTVSSPSDADTMMANEHVGSSKLVTY